MRRRYRCLSSGHGFISNQYGPIMENFRLQKKYGFHVTGKKMPKLVASGPFPVFQSS